MSTRRKHYPPPVVQKNCQQFLAALEKYWPLVLERLRVLRENERQEPPEGTLVNIGRARLFWADLEKYGRQILEAGRAWQMDSWLYNHPEFSPRETSDFFDIDEPNPQPDGGSIDEGTLTDPKSRLFEDLYPSEVHTPISEPHWESTLKQFLSWMKTNTTPLGFGDGVNETDEVMLEFLYEELHIDVRALLAAAHEQLVGLPNHVDTGRPLTARRKAVLDLIPVGANSGGITGGKIVEKLWKTATPVSQASLTSDIIPWLKNYYHVDVLPGGGYYRTH